MTLCPICCQTILDDKSGYDLDGILLIVHTSLWLENIPICFPYYRFACHMYMYIDDLHNGQLPSTKSAYAVLETDDNCRFAAAKSPIFFCCKLLGCTRLFSWVEQVNSHSVEDSSLSRFLGRLHQAFRLILIKRDRFVQLVHKLLNKPKVTVHDLQCLAGKCVAFSPAVLAAKLFTRE